MNYIRTKKYWHYRDGKMIKRNCKVRISVYLCILTLIMVGGIYYTSEMNRAACVRQKALEDELARIQSMNYQLIEEIYAEIQIINTLANLEGTPMEGAIPHIRRASRYYGIPVEVFLGIANAESSLKNFRCFNPKFFFW